MQLRVLFAIHYPLDHQVALQQDLATLAANSLEGSGVGYLLYDGFPVASPFFLEGTDTETLGVMVNTADLRVEVVTVGNKAGQGSGDGQQA